jgi:hypothetical protein
MEIVSQNSHEVGLIFVEPRVVHVAESEKLVDFDTNFSDNEICLTDILFILFER